MAILFAVVFATLARADTVSPDLSPLTIHTTNGGVEFQVELAATPETRGWGLMFREQLERHEGMLFDYHSPRHVRMWMKNTLIPLDMLFITDKGVIARIEANTEPMSMRVIASGEPVRAVLELKGGTAEEFAIQPGDWISHRIFAAP